MPILSLRSQRRASTVCGGTCARSAARKFAEAYIRRYSRQNFPFGPEGWRKPPLPWRAPCAAGPSGSLHGHAAVGVKQDSHKKLNVLKIRIPQSR